MKMCALCKHTVIPSLTLLLTLAWSQGAAAQDKVSHPEAAKLDDELYRDLALPGKDADKVRWLEKDLHRDLGPLMRQRDQMRSLLSKEWVEKKPNKRSFARVMKKILDLDAAIEKRKAKFLEDLLLVLEQGQRAKLLDIQKKRNACHRDDGPLEGPIGPLGEMPTACPKAGPHQAPPPPGPPDKGARPGSPSPGGPPAR